MSPTYIVLGVFLLVAAFLMVPAFLRRGKNLLATMPPLNGETTLVERDLEFSILLRRRALYSTLVFLPVRVRVTNARLIIAQPGLFGGEQRVLRFVFHLESSTASEPSTWKDGVTTLVVDPSKSGTESRDGKPVLKLVPTDDAPHIPECVVLRGEAVAEIAERANLRAL